MEVRMAGSSQQPRDRKIAVVGKDSVRVEFTIDEIVNLAILHPGQSVAACNGCNHCMAAEIGPLEGGN
jgi:hypothetical protein